MSKYNNQKTVVDGITFDSKKEAARWQELLLLQKAGKITDLQRQVKFVLIPTQRINGYVIERECYYKADFVYKMPVDTVKCEPMSSGRMYRVPYKEWKTIVEDTKGFRTPDYVIKRKLMLYVHGIEIKEI